MLYVSDAEYLEEYKIRVVFNDNSSGVVDLQKVIFEDHRPIFNELKDIQKFRDFRVDMDTIVWSNGLDLAPEFIKENISSV